MVKELEVDIMGNKFRIVSKTSHFRHTILYQKSDTQWLKYKIVASCKLCCINECHCDPKDNIVRGELTAFSIIQVGLNKFHTSEYVKHLEMQQVHLKMEQVGLELMDMDD